MSRTLSPAPLAGVDLNLLLVLDALLSELSVTGAASKIGLSQSATSHALGRLRDLLGDPILLRVGRRMVPTARARAIGISVREIIARCEAALMVEPSFSAQESRVRFRISLDFSVQLNVLPGLVRKILAQAPGISLEILSLQPDTLYRDLETGAIDFAIWASNPPPTTGIRSDFLAESDFVSVVRRGHPQAPRKLSLAKFLALRHATVQLPGLADPVIDRHLTLHGLQRQVALTLETPGTLPTLVAQGDLCATFPRMLLSQAQVDSASLLVFPPPIEIPPVQIFLLSHGRIADSPGHAWIRERLEEVFGDLDRSPRPSGRRPNPPRSTPVRDAAMCNRRRAASRSPESTIPRRGTAKKGTSATNREER